MATKPTLRTQLDVFLGKAEKHVGRLIFVKDGQREFSQFAYTDAWLLPTHRLRCCAGLPVHWEWG